MGQTQLAQAVRRAREGDREAWGDIYRQYAPAIFRFCRRALPAREDAEDATIEIFMKLGEKLGRYDETRPFDKWLYRVAANHCWDALRRRHVRQDLETGDAEALPLAAPGPDPLTHAMSERSGAEVRVALAKLPPRSRMALVLRYYSDLDYGEIAEVLGIRPAAVGVVLLRARHQLREVFVAAGGARGGQS